MTKFDIMIYKDIRVLTKFDIMLYKDIRALTKIQTYLTIFILSIEVSICFRQVPNHILSNFIKIVRKVVESNINVIRDLFIDTKTNIVDLIALLFQ